jgi:hypothetical protein
MARRHALLATLAVVPLWLVGSGAPAFASLCDGAWRVEAGPWLQGDLNDVAIVGSGELWATGTAVVGGAWRPVIAHRLNGRWETTAFASGSSLRVVAARPGSAWVLGSNSNGDSLIMKRVGNRWLPQHIAPTGSQLTGITVRSTTDVWIAGSMNGHPLALHFDGSSWRQFVLPGGGFAVGVAAHGPKDVWLVGETGDGLNPAAWHWNGAAWQSQAPPGAGGLFEIDISRAGTVWAVGAEDAGDCCHTFATVTRHDQTGWTTIDPSVPVISRFGTSLWTPQGVVASDATNGTSMVGYDFEGDGGGGITYPVIATWTGHGWARQNIHGLPKNPANAWLLGLDGDDHGGRWAVGHAPSGRVLVVHQCIA